MKMHLSITVAWFVLAFLSLSKVAQQLSEVSTSSIECPPIYVGLFRKQKGTLIDIAKYHVEPVQDMTIHFEKSIRFKNQIFSIYTVVTNSFDKC